MIFPQLILILICALLPAYFIYFRKRHDLAVAWLAVITVLDVFNSQLYMNLAAILIFGVAVIPYLYLEWKTLSSNLVLKVFAIYFAYLVILGIYHGFVFPWPDLTGQRSIKDQAQFRTILHLGRSACEWLSVLYLVVRIEKNKRGTVDQFLRWVFYCSVLLCISTFIERTFQIDFYHFFTGGRELLLPTRPRGMTYEPRGLSQNLTYAILLMPFFPFRNWKYLFVPVFAFFAYVYTISFTGVAILLAGLFIFCILYLLKQRHFILLHLKKVLLMIIAFMVITVTAFYLMPVGAKVHLTERFDYFTQHDLAEKFEVFDAAAINFYIHNPRYLALGTGPGLIYLPSGPYILERDIPYWKNQFNALPHVGLILLLSNAGVVGLLIFLFGFFMAVKSKWKSEFTLLAIGCVLGGLFFIQLRYFYIFGFACLMAKICSDDPNSTADSLISRSFLFNHIPQYPGWFSTPSHLTARKRFLSKIKNEYQIEKVENCIICSSKERILVSTQERHALPINVVMCKNCSFIYNGLRLDEKSIMNHYETDAFAIERGSRQGLSDSLFLSQKTKAKKILNFVEGIIEFKDDDLIVEVGSGLGGIIAGLQQEGRKAVGIEPNSSSVDYGLAHGANLHQGTLSNNPEDVKTARLVLFEQSLEHILNPRHELTLLQSLQPVGSFLYIGVPGVLDVKERYNSNFVAYLEYQHVWHFNLHILERLLNQHHYRLIKGNEEVQALFERVAAEEIGLPKAKPLSSDEMILFLKNQEAAYLKNFHYSKQHLGYLIRKLSAYIRLAILR